MKAVGIIPAAGFSSRMGAFKPLLELEGKSALERVFEALSPVCSQGIAVVTGHRREELAPVIASLGAAEIINPDYAEGMFTSVRAGIAFAERTEADGVLLLPCDTPLVTRDAVRLLFTACGPNGFAIACHKNKNGHPLWIPRRFFADILSFEGDGGLKAVRRRYNSETLRVETGCPGCMLDMDSPEDYQRILFMLGGERFKSALAGRRLILIRHGQTVPHSGKIYMGQCDPPLSDIGRATAKEAAGKVSRLMPRALRVYHSGLSRARETAALIAQTLQLPLFESRALAEASLGEWDGRLIEEIKREFPEEYERRGRSLETYRTPGGENSYDMSGRVRACLTEILNADPSADIVAVTHAGPVRAVLSAVLGCGYSDTRMPAYGEITEIINGDIT